MNFYGFGMEEATFCMVQSNIRNPLIEEGLDCFLWNRIWGNMFYATIAMTWFNGYRRKERSIKYH